MTVIWALAYGLPRGTKSGGTLLQNLFVQELKSLSVEVHIFEITSRHRALEFVGELSAASIRNDESTRSNEGGTHLKHTDRLVVVMDGISAFWCGPKLLSKIRILSNVGCLCSFVHFPFSASHWYQREAWLQSVDGLEVNKNYSSGENLNELRKYETALLSVFQKHIVVGHTCRTALTEMMISDEKLYTIDVPMSSLAHEKSLLCEKKRSRIDGNKVASTKNARNIQFVTVGTVCARKNQAVLVRALHSVAAKYNLGVDRRVNSTTSTIAQPVSVHLSLCIIGDTTQDPEYVLEVEKLVLAAAAGIDAGATATMTTRYAEGIASSHLSRPSPPRQPFQVSVHFTGALAPAAVLDWVARADAFLFASRFESYGIAPLEAALLGVPIVATRSGIFAEHLFEDATIWVKHEERGPMNKINGTSPSDANEVEEGEKINGYGAINGSSEVIDIKEEVPQWERALESFLQSLGVLACDHTVKLSNEHAFNMSSKLGDASASAVSSVLSEPRETFVQSDSQPTAMLATLQGNKPKLQQAEALVEQMRHARERYHPGRFTALVEAIRADFEASIFV